MSTFLQCRLKFYLDKTVELPKKPISWIAKQGIAKHEIFNRDLNAHLRYGKPTQYSIVLQEGIRYIIPEWWGAVMVFSDVIIHGFVDALAVADSVRILEYKSGKAYESHLDEILYYMYLVSNFFEVCDALVVYDREPFLMQLKASDLTALAGFLEIVFSLMKLELENPTYRATPNAQICKYCEHLTCEYNPKLKRSKKKRKR